jgi:hypothetical protein
MPAVDVRVVERLRDTACVRVELLSLVVIGVGRRAKRAARSRPRPKAALMVVEKVLTHR